MTGAARATSLDGGLAGRRVLVTAGAAGIGLAIVERLLAHRRTCSSATSTTRRFIPSAGRHPQAGAIKADVSTRPRSTACSPPCRPRSAASTRSSTMPELQARPERSRISTPAEWRRCIDIGLTGQFLCTRRAVPMLKAAGGGSIINMSSAAGRHGYAFRTPYAAIRQAFATAESPRAEDRRLADVVRLFSEAGGFAAIRGNSSARFWRNVGVAFFRILVDRVRSQCHNAGLQELAQRDVALCSMHREVQPGQHFADHPGVGGRRIA